MNQFFHYTLRTSDVPAARAFYAAVIGDQALDVVQLHETAVARGAKPHWLSCLDVGEVARAAAACKERGAAALGPRFVRPEGAGSLVRLDATADARRTKPSRARRSGGPASIGARRPEKAAACRLG